MNPKDLVDGAAGTLRSHRGTIIFWIVLLLAPFVIGQIIAGPGSFPYVLGLMLAAGFLYLAKRHFVRTLIGFAIILALIFAFGSLVKATVASTGTQPAEEETGQVSEPVVAEEETAEEVVEEPPYQCTSIANFDDNVKQWCQLIDDYADDYNLDPVLVASIIQIESGGNADSVSYKGAIGIMQVMSKDTGYWIFRDRPTASELLNPAINIKTGQQVLADCIEKYDSLQDSVQCYYGFDGTYDYANKVLAVYEEKSS